MPSQSSPFPRPGVSSAVFRDGKVLLVQRSKPPLRGVWSLPGGHIEPGEAAMAAAHRELLEETGVRADLRGVADVADVILHHDDGSLRVHYVLTVFYGLWTDGIAAAASDAMGVQWATRGEIAGLETTNGVQRLIDTASRCLPDSSF